MLFSFFFFNASHSGNLYAWNRNILVYWDLVQLPNSPIFIVTWLSHQPAPAAFAVLSYCFAAAGFWCHFVTSLHPWAGPACHSPICSPVRPWWTISYLPTIPIPILTISIYNSHLPAHFCVHLYTCLSLQPAKGRSTHWLCFLLNHHTSKLAGMEIHQQNENFEQNCNS